MRLPQMTTRRLMLVVIVAAALLGDSLEVVKMIRHSADFRQRSIYHSRLESSFRQQIAEAQLEAENLERMAKRRPSKYGDQVKRHASTWAKRRPRKMAWAEYHAKLKWKYELAARHPWASVSPGEFQKG